MTQLVITNTSALENHTGSRIEIVERKGLGHPDTIADAIAERFTDLYSAFSLAEFGNIPHHWVDKTMTIGGEADLRFGMSSMVKPIRVLVVGKATRSVGGAAIPFDAIGRQAAADVFAQATPLLDMHEEVTVDVDLNDAVGAGRSAAWYRPAATADLADRTPRSNDTVMCTGYAPLSDLESLVLLIEHVLNSGELKSRWPAIGSDIKVLARRVDSDVEIVCCVPCVARLVSSRDEYDACVADMSALIGDLCALAAPEFNTRILLNTRDGETVYLTHSGTALDTGDVGVVGRGNKLNGLIPLCRETGIEAPCGKNPTYHGGRIYSIVAQYIADQVWQRTGTAGYVNLVAANGDKISSPAFVGVKIAETTADVRSEIDDIVKDALRRLDRPERELPAVLQEMMLPPAERLTTPAWIVGDAVAGLAPLRV